MLECGAVDGSTTPLDLATRGIGWTWPSLRSSLVPGSSASSVRSGRYRRRRCHFLSFVPCIPEHQFAWVFADGAYTGGLTFLKVIVATVASRHISIKARERFRPFISTMIRKRRGQSRTMSPWKCARIHTNRPRPMMCFITSMVPPPIRAIRAST